MKNSGPNKWLSWEQGKLKEDEVFSLSGLKYKKMNE